MDITAESGASGPAAPDQTPDVARRPRGAGLHRSRDGRILAGVAAGVADYFEIDPTLVRVGFAALALVGGLAVPVYLAAWLLIPEEGSETSVAEELLDRERSR